METCHRRRSGVLERDVDEEKILFDQEDNQIHQLNSTAAFIWELCDGNRSIEDIANMVADNFDVSFSVALTDVKAVLTEFQKRRLVEVT